jgi:hypothetical protein
MTAIGVPIDLADARKKIVVYIHAGQYDENVNIPQQRMMTLYCMGTVVLGDGLADDYYNSTTPRTLTIQNTATGEPIGAPSRSTFNIKGVTSEVSSTHHAYGTGNIIISGNLVFNHLDGNTTSHETYLCGVKVKGDVTCNANELGSVHNITIEKCYFDGTFTLGTVNINVCRSTKFDGLITATGFGRFLECEIRGGITGAMVNYYPPNGFYHCVVNGGTWTITNVRIDDITLQSIIDNAITITGGYISLGNSVAKSDYNENTLLVANTDNTPTTLTIAASRFVGRKSTGSIAALTPVEVLAELSGSSTTSFSMNNQKITNLDTPTNSLDAVNKYYADSIAAGLDPKASCHVATTAELNATFVYNGSLNNGVGDTLTNAGVQIALSIDDIALLVGDRVLVKDQDTTISEISSVDTVADVSGSLGGKYFLISAYATSISIVYTDYYVWYDVDDGSINPNVANRTGIEIDISEDDTADTIASNTETILEALNSGETFDVTIASGNEMTITHVVGGAVANVTAGDSGFTVAVDTSGSSNKKSNGIYTVTNIGSGAINWILTRSTDSDNSPDGEVSAGN